MVMADVESKRYSNIDLLKTVAIVMVVALHIPVWRWDFLVDGQYHFGIWIQYCFRLISEGVPVFFMVNGYLLFEKKFNPKKHMFKCIKIFALFLLWAVIQSASLALCNKTELSFSAIINHIIVLDYPSTLWFYKYLIFIYIFFPVLKIVFDAKKRYFVFFFLVTLFFTTSIHFFEGMNYLFDYAGITCVKGLNVFLTDLYPLNAKGAASITFFLLGGMINAYKDKIERKKICG